MIKLVVVENVCTPNKLWMLYAGSLFAILKRTILRNSFKDTNHQVTPPKKTLNVLRWNATKAHMHLKRDSVIRTCLQLSVSADFACLFPFVCQVNFIFILKMFPRNALCWLRVNIAAFYSMRDWLQQLSIEHWLGLFLSDIHFLSNNINERH